MFASGLQAGSLRAQSVDPGVTATEIKIGQTWAFSGPVSGEAYQTKVHAGYFARLNETGGINGRKITLISLDDGYSPARTVEQTRKLVERDEVFLVFAPFGTPTNAASLRYLNNAKIPQLFVASGSSRFYDDVNAPWSLGYLPSYETEGNVYGRYILELANRPASPLADPKIGILYQNDDFGREYVRGLKRGLGEKAASLIVKELSYEPTDPTIESQLVTLKASGANVFMNFSAGRAVSQSIKKASEIGWTPLQFLDSPWANIEDVLKPAGIEKSNGILSIAYLKEPRDPRWQTDVGVKEFVDFMKKYVPDVNPYSRNAASAYLAADLLAETIRRAGNDVTRSNVMAKALTLKDQTSPVLLPGITVSISPTQRSPIQTFQIVKFNGETWVPQETLSAK